MKHIIFTIISFICVQSFSYAQGCDGFRYLNDIATSTSMETVQFGQNLDVLGNTQDLFMDIYTPDGDVETNRPVIIFAYGGSFVGGNREDMAGYCQIYARKGYVTVSIDYRLYNLALGIPDSLGMMDVVVKAVSDMKGAIRWLRKDAIDGGNTYNIDPNKIYVGGLSAGAITALHTAYITPNTSDGILPDYIQTIIDNNGGIDGDTDLPGDSNIGYSSSTQAVVNMSGALHRANFLEAGGPPVVSAHGDQDGTVPYGFGSAVVFGIPIATLQGSSMVHARAVEQSVVTELYTVVGGGHTDFYWSSPHEENIETTILNFLHTNVTCEGVVDNTNIEDVSHAIKIYPTPADAAVNITTSNLNETYTIKILDITGKEIRTISDINENVYSLKRDNLSSGMYHIHIIFDNEKLAPVNKKIVFK